MSKNQYAFIDEFGAFGFNFQESGCSTHFIISAIIVDEENILEVSKGVDIIRKKYCQTGEIKSNKISNKHGRRIAILNELKELPFKVFAFVCDKRKIYENSGLRYKQSFYKFLNNIVHQELYATFSNITIVADEIGGNEYLKSFAAYVRSKEVPLDLFGTRLFKFENSKDSPIIQVADIISGSLAFNYDEHKKKTAEGKNYKSILSEKILLIKTFPESFDTFVLPDAATESSLKYNAQIAEVCYKKAKIFIDNNNRTDDETIKQQIGILKYLLFMFMNKYSNRYISTKELINQLIYLGYDKLEVQAFRNKIIANLRDNEVIIASSSAGYKIPSTVEELYDFINHGKSIINPMLSRLRICNDIIKLGTSGNIDLFKSTGCQEFQKILDEKLEHTSEI